MERVCLVIIFNHRYDKNIEKLVDIYHNRFHDIYILMPFYDGEQYENVTIISVYESSFMFSGYIAQAYGAIKKEYSHYVIIGDDLIINPMLNENNIIEYLGLTNNQCYIKDIRPIGSSNGINAQRLSKFTIYPFIVNSGVEYKNQIYNRDDAYAIVKDKGYEANQTMSYKWLANVIRAGGRKRIINSIYDVVRMIIRNKGRSYPYPLFKIYSDFIILSNSSFKEIVKYFGVFAAMGLFVEVAIPTSLVLNAESIVTEKMIDKHGIEFWDNKKLDDFSKSKDFSLSRLFSDYPENVIYYHPIKLSKWNN